MKELVAEVEEEANHPVVVEEAEAATVVVVTAEEMVAKIESARSAADEILVIARTDAIAVEGLERALDRAERYVEAGADVLFVEAPRDDLEVVDLVLPPQLNYTVARAAGRPAS